jgi:hypothetical protein
MKSVAMVAVLFSILLLVGGTASAICANPICYHVYATCDKNDIEGEADVSLCVTDHYGQICSEGIISGCADLASFGYGGGWKFDGRDTKWMAAGDINGDPASLYVETSGGAVMRDLRGIGYVLDGLNMRCLLYGYREDCIE